MIERGEVDRISLPRRQLKEYGLMTNISPWTITDDKPLIAATGNEFVASGDIDKLKRFSQVRTRRPGLLRRSVYLSSWSFRATSFQRILRCQLSYTISASYYVLYEKYLNRFLTINGKDK